MTRGARTRAPGAPVGRAERIEGVVQGVIMLAIGSAAGAASFTHVHDVAAAHGQSGWLAWADAVTLELMSIASGMELRRRRRGGQSAAMPEAILVVAVLLLLSAQVVEAERSVIGWLAAALPALGFLAMAKIALGRGDAVWPRPIAPPIASAAGLVVPMPADMDAMAAGEAPTLAGEPARDAPRVPMVRASGRTANRPARERSQTHAGHALPGTTRRTAAQTRRLAIELMAAEPGLTRTRIADRLGISARWLRQLMSAASTEGAAVDATSP